MGILHHTTCGVFFLFVIVLESRDFLRCIAAAALKILWRYFVLTDRDSRPFSLDSCSAEKLTDATTGLRCRDRCPHRESLHHPLPHLWLCRPVPSDPRSVGLAAPVLRATNNSRRTFFFQRQLSKAPGITACSLRRSQAGRNACVPLTRSVGEAPLLSRTARIWRRRPAMTQPALLSIRG
jgi:hypothetical protein